MAAGLDRAAWERFLAGHWRTTIPEERGMFPRATRDGLEAPAAYVCKGPDPDGSPVAWWSPHGEWRGWWWSAPIPDLPRPPPWTYEYPQEGA